jgi:hypothetical protein
VETFVLRGKPARKGTALIVQEERVLHRLLREHALGEAWDEHNAKGSASDLFDAGNEDMAVPAVRLILFECYESPLQDSAYFRDSHGADAAEGFEFGEQSQHASWVTECPPCEGAQPVKPLTPRTGVPHVPEEVHEGECEVLELSEVGEFPS